MLLRLHSSAADDHLHGARETMSNQGKGSLGNFFEDFRLSQHIEQNDRLGAILRTVAA